MKTVDSILRQYATWRNCPPLWRAGFQVLYVRFIAEENLPDDYIGLMWEMYMAGRLDEHGPHPTS